MLTIFSINAQLSELISATMQHIRSLPYFHLALDLLRTQLEATDREDARYKAWRHLDRLLIPTEFLPSEKLAFLSTVKAKDLRIFVEKLLEENPESLLFGNIAHLAEPIAHSLKSTASSRKPPQLYAQPGEFTYIFPSANNNNALLRRYEIGSFSLRGYAVLLVLQCLLEDAMFNELRTKQHLGYVVHAVLDTRLRHLGLILVLQSPTYSPDTLQERLLIFLHIYQKELTLLDDRDLDALLDSVAMKAEKPEAGFTERRETVWRHIVTQDFAFEEKQQVAAQIRSLSREDLVEVMKDMVESPTVLSVQASAKGETGGIPLDYFLSYKL